MHTPVLLKEVLEQVRVESLESLIDGTVGDGGYIWEISKFNPVVKILGIDLDQASLDKLHMRFAHEHLSQTITLVHGNYKHIRKLAVENGFDQVSAVILDLGFSSSQLDDPSYGLSFQTSGPLDMRFDRQNPLTAEKLVNEYPEGKLAEVFRKYGELNLASKIAHEIVRTRKQARIQDTGNLFEVIKQSLPKPVAHKAGDFARKVFQALRIEINQELENLNTALPQILELLKPGGRMLVISFHSLEDRIVKQFMVKEARGCVCPPDFPTCVCGKNPQLKVITKKPIMASERETSENPRSMPAKLRVAEKTTI